MKKILFFILIAISLNGLAQDFPGVQSLSSPTTRLIVNGGLDAKKGMINGNYVDTTAANLGYIDFHHGAQIWTTSDKNLWLRDSVLNRWLRMAKFSEVGGGVPTIQQVLTAGNIVTDQDLHFGDQGYISWDYVNDGFNLNQYNTGNNMVFEYTALGATTTLNFGSTAASNVYYFPVTGRASDTLATLFDVRAGGGGSNKVDSVTLRNDSLFYWIGGTNTLITPVVPYDFTSLADYDILRYDAGGGSFVNTNKIEKLRWIPRQDSTTSSATPTINTDNVDIYKLTAQAADITSFTTNLSGTPRHGEIIEIQITGTATRNITWGSAFVSSTTTLPTATDGTNTLTVILQYYTNSSYGNFKWVCVSYY